MQPLALDLIERELHALLPGIDAGFRKCANDQRRAGELLLQAKKKLGHGKYTPWLRANGWRLRTAQVACQIALALRQRPEWEQYTSLSAEKFLTLARDGRRLEREQHRRKIGERINPPHVTGLIHGQALDWLRDQPDDSIPFYVTDPPYGIGLSYGDWTEADTAEGHWAWLEPYWREIVRTLQPGGQVLMYQGYGYIFKFFDWFPGCRIIADCFRSRNLRMWEPIVQWQKPGKPLVPMRGHNDFTLGRKADDFCGTTDHPCPKPVGAVRRLINDYTLPGALVADPFMGTGTVPLAAKLEGRKWVGVERHEPYYRVACERLGSKN